MDVFFADREQTGYLLTTSSAKRNRCFFPALSSARRVAKIMSRLQAKACLRKTDEKRNADCRTARKLSVSVEQKNQNQVYLYHGLPDREQPITPCASEHLRGTSASVRRRDICPTGSLCL